MTAKLIFSSSYCCSWTYFNRLMKPRQYITVEQIIQLHLGTVNAYIHKLFSPKAVTVSLFLGLPALLWLVDSSGYSSAEKRQWLWSFCPRGETLFFPTFTAVFLPFVHHLFLLLFAPYLVTVCLLSLFYLSVPWQKNRWTGAVSPASFLPWVSTQFDLCSGP